MHAQIAQYCILICMLYNILLYGVREKENTICSQSSETVVVFVSDNIYFI